MFSVTDQLGHTIQLPGCPRRIISLVPSITELLYDLTLEEEVPAITSFCVHPNHWFNKKIKIGGPKKLHTTKIATLAPELIIGNKEENTENDVELLKQLCPVWLSDVKTLSDALLMIESIGKLCCRETIARKLLQDITSAFDQLRQHPAFTLQPISAAYLIWRAPYMIAGSDTFINDMMMHCNLSNAFADKFRYPVVDVAQLRASNASLILVSSEPYPFKDEHINELKDALPGKTVMFVDGEMFSWYGSRLVKAAMYFRQMLESIHYSNLPTYNE